MKKYIELPPYDGDAVDVIINREESGYDAVVIMDAASINMNKAFMMDLAYQMIYFAQNNLQDGSHIHYDEFFCPLNAGTFELLLCKDSEDCYSLRIQKK